MLVTETVLSGEGVMTVVIFGASGLGVSVVDGSMKSGLSGRMGGLGGVLENGETFSDECGPTGLSTIKELSVIGD